MSTALNINAFARRGACPTLDLPMATGDGLLARLRFEGPCVSPSQLADVARLARLHGNGLVEVTARGNLQARGLTPVSAPRFADAVWNIVPIATGLVVDMSPIAGEDPQEQADPRPLVRAIRDGASEFEGRLGPKVCVVVDGGGLISLAGLKADMRLLAVGDGAWAVTVGKGLPEVTVAKAAVEATISAIRELAEMGIEARAVDLESGLDAPSPGLPREGGGVLSSAGQDWAPSTAGTPSASREEMGWEATRLELTRGYTVPVTLPFGAMAAHSLISLAEAAVQMGVENIRLAPEHSLLIDNAPTELIHLAEALGFITAADDPRLRISACIGSAGCASGHVPARALAARLAAYIAPDQQLHVSGCAKGCAHPRAADVTLVGRADGIGLVFNGRAGDTPSAIVDEAGLSDALAAHQEGR